MKFNFKQKGQIYGLVHTMPDKFENATLLLRLGLLLDLLQVERSEPFLAPKQPTASDEVARGQTFLKSSLLSTLQRTYPHKKIRKNGTFWMRSLEWNNLKTQLFCISVDR